MIYECKLCGKVCHNIAGMAYHSRFAHGVKMPMADYEKVLQKHIRKVNAAIAAGAELIVFALIILLKIVALPGHMLYRWLQ